MQSLAARDDLGQVNLREKKRKKPVRKPAFERAPLTVLLAHQEGRSKPYGEPWLQAGDWGDQEPEVIEYPPLRARGEESRV